MKLNKKAVVYEGGALQSGDLKNGLVCNSHICKCIRVRKRRFSKINVFNSTLKIAGNIDRQNRFILSKIPCNYCSATVWGIKEQTSVYFTKHLAEAGLYHYDIKTILRKELNMIKHMEAFRKC
ncbi:hypothetical protein [Lacrimispora indolis]|uniref:hypothetical protein n=1 Tax=Lacrimispora indolis TaxID=69825 RepID=UPI00046275C0|nr:hypothetical protein [[Clostridium] methoxybenzovorans]